MSKNYKFGRLATTKTILLIWFRLSILIKKGRDQDRDQEKILFFLTLISTLIL